MNTVTRLGQVLVATSLLTSTLVHGAPLSNREMAKIYCAHKGYCARTSNSRIMYITPLPKDADRPLRFNLIDGEPIR